MIPAEYDSEKVVKALDAIWTFIRMAAELEAEEIEGEMKMSFDDSKR